MRLIPAPLRPWRMIFTCFGLAAVLHGMHLALAHGLPVLPVVYMGAVVLCGAGMLTSGRVGLNGVARKAHAIFLGVALLFGGASGLWATATVKLAADLVWVIPTGQVVLTILAAVPLTLSGLLLFAQCLFEVDTSDPDWVILALRTGLARRPRT